MVSISTRRQRNGQIWIGTRCSITMITSIIFWDKPKTVLSLPVLSWCQDLRNQRTPQGQGMACLVLHQDVHYQDAIQQLYKRTKSRSRTIHGQKIAMCTVEGHLTMCAVQHSKLRPF